MKALLASLIFMRFSTLLQRRFAPWAVGVLRARAYARHQFREDGYKVWLAMTTVLVATFWFTVDTAPGLKNGTWSQLSAVAVLSGMAGLLLQVVQVARRLPHLLRAAKQTAHKDEAYIADLASAEALRARWCASELNGTLPLAPPSSSHRSSRL